MKTVTKTLTKQQIVQLASGACFFAAGGGGALATGQGLAESIPDSASIPLVTIREAAKDTDQLTAVAIYVGAPTSGSTAEPTAALNAFDALNDWCQVHLKKSIGYLVPGEMGAVNATTAAAVAAGRQLSLVDADGAGGRSLPVLELASPNAFGVTTNPSFICNAVGETLQSDVSSASDTDALIRGVISAPMFNEWAGVALWIMPGAVVQRAVPTQGTVSRSIAYGEVITGKSTNKAEQILKMLQRDVPVFRVWHGVVQSVTEQESGGFDVGSVNVQLGDGSLLTAVNQNENLVLWNSAEAVPAVILPDSVNYLGAEGQAISNVEIGNYLKQPIYLIGIRALEWMQTNPIAQAAGRSTLAGAGYFGPYVPLQSAAVTVSA